MMTQRAYYDFSAAKLPAAFASSILEARPHKNGFALILDKTIFYPEGGGQSGDRGTINGHNVLDVIEENGEILHIVNDMIRPGQAELALDIRRRVDFTVQHTAQHLLSGTLLRLTGFPTVSMHLGEEYNTIDADGKDLNRQSLAEVEDEIASAIERNNPVSIHLCPPENIGDFPLRKIPPKGEEVIRVVEIEGCDFSPCCGTHLSSIGQIGMLRILDAEKYKGMTRITFIAGRRCLRDARMLRENAETISKTLKVPVEETGKAVLSLLEKTGALEEKLKGFEEEAAGTKARSIIEKAKLEGAGHDTWYAEYFSDAGMEDVIRIGKKLQELSEAVFVLASEKDAKFAALCSVKGADIRPRLKEALEKAGGRGGGGPGFFQGQFASATELKAFIKGFETK